VALIICGILLPGEFEKVRPALIVAGMAMSLWLVGMLLVRWSTLPEAAPKEAPAAAGPRGEPIGMLLWWQPVLTVLSASIFILALPNLARNIGSIEAAIQWLLRGTGLYWLLLVLGSVSCLLGGRAMQNAGSVPPVRGAKNATRDRLWMLRFGGRALTASGVGFMLVAFWHSQSLATRPSGAGAESASGGGDPIGFFDLMTWLGTFATFVTVIATALVAMYVKRRDDESRHSASVIEMRQRWIDKLRQNLAMLMAAGHQCRAAAELREPNRDLASHARGVLREVELQLNPTEGHHAVLLSALRSWLHLAGIEDHFRAREMPQPLRTPEEFDKLAEWLVKLGQLVLKVEWVVTSLSHDSVEDKASRLWDELRRFEKRYEAELNQMAPEAMRHRAQEARGLLEGANASAAPNS
jgi:hypothetical protein